VPEADICSATNCNVIPSPRRRGRDRWVGTESASLERAVFFSFLYFFILRDQAGGELDSNFKRHHRRPLNCTSKISGLRRQIDIVHKQCVNASLAECDDRVGGRADNWLAVVERRIDDDRYSGSCKKAGYEIVKARI
jgi:hypothetical protein